MFRLRCLGDLLGLEERDVQVAAAAPELGGPDSNSSDEAQGTGPVGEGAHGPDAALDLAVQPLE